MSAIATAPPTAASLPFERQTTVGNYFVSNYPPYSFWSPEKVDELQAALQRPPAPGTPLGVYVHIPFCRKRCHFCYFKVYTDKNSKQIQAYLDGMIAEHGIYAKAPLLKDRRAEFVYFGGGTPSYLSVDQLRHLVGAMKKAISWEGVEEVTFEAEPGTLNEAKLKGIRELGITRLSLGIENFDDHILEVNGRAHHSEEVFRAYDFARKCGFEQINIDLIAGMLEETEENWRRCVAKTIELSPDSVTIYEMEVPYNTTIYKQMKAQGRLVAPVADWETKRRWVDYAFNELVRGSYTIASAYTAVKNPAKARFVYRDKLWAGADLVAIGVSSFGHLGGTHYQNHHDYETYLQRIGAGQLPVYRALTPTHEERFIREFILQLKLGHVRRSYFKDKFGIDPVEQLQAPIEDLANAGMMRLNDGTIELTRAGLLQVDRLLHEFFLPEHRAARYA